MPIRRSGFGGVGTLVLVWAAFSVTGCGESTGPTGEVKGRLTHNGTPVSAGTVVQFISTAGAGAGTVETDGRFVAKNLQVGHYQVSIGAPAAAMTPEQAMLASQKAQKEGKPMSSSASEIPSKYQRPDSSGATLDVKQGTNDFTLDMKD